MSQNNNYKGKRYKKDSPAPKKMNNSNYSVSEIANKYNGDAKAQELKAAFASVSDALRLVDLSKTDNRTYQSFSKTKLRQFMRNPMNNQVNLRNLSQFLYRMCYPYRRIITYFATMMDLTARIVVPKVQIVKDNDPNKILKDYEKVVNEEQKLNLQSQIIKMNMINWREDTAYGYIYEDDSGFFIMPLDGNYCRISSIDRASGTYNFAFDFSYFRTYGYLLEYWDAEFKKKYDAYDKDSSLRWQELDPARTYCTKVNEDDTSVAMPPFISLFEAIIDLVDLQSIQAAKENLSAYKLLVMTALTRDKADDVNQWKVDIDDAIQYYNRFSASLPDEVSAAFSLLPIEPIDFKGNSTDDVDMISNSMSNLFKQASVTQILDKSKISGTEAFEAAMISDSMIVLGTLLPQVENWVNRYLSYSLGSNIKSKVKYLPITPYTKKNYFKQVLSAAEYGVPVKSQVAALLNLSPLETYSMQYLENEVLKMHDVWIPLQSSHTQSGGGAVEQSSSEEENTNNKKSVDKSTSKKRNVRKAPSTDNVISGSGRPKKSDRTTI